MAKKAIETGQLGIKQALNKGFRKLRPTRAEIETLIFGYVLVFPENFKTIKPLLLPPIEVELFNVPGLHVIFGGIIWNYLLSNDLDLKQFPFILKDDGLLHLLRKEVDQYEPIMDLMRGRDNCGWRITE